MTDFVETIAAAAREVTNRHIALIADALRDGDGCRAVTLDPPGSARGIYAMHEWPKPTRWQWFTDALLGPFAKPRPCHCGEMRR